MANISFTINFTLPPHDTLTQQCVVFYVGAYKVRDCYHQVHSVNAVQNWTAFCDSFATGSSHSYSNSITTDIEIDSQCNIALQIYAIPCCFLVENLTGQTTIPCTAVTYPPTPIPLLTSPGISSFTQVINPNNLYTNCRRYILGLNGSSTPTITDIQYGLCNPPDVYYCSQLDFNQIVNPVNIVIPGSLQSSLLNTPVLNGTNIENCAYSNPELDNLAIGQTFFPPYGVIKLCADTNSPPVLSNTGNPLSAPADYHVMSNGNVSCDECCHKCRQYRVILTSDSFCGGSPQFFAFQNCRDNYRLQILQIGLGDEITICAVEGTITWLTPCLGTNGFVIYEGNCYYSTIPTP